MPKKKAEVEVHKLIIVGTGGVGKSALTLMFMYGDFVEEYDPTLSDSYRKLVTLDGREMNIDILDTAGQEDYSAMRDNYYRTGEGFMCVYSVIMEDSFNKLQGFFDAIIRVSDKEKVPFLLVGNKIDLESQRQVDSIRGQELAAKYDCSFMETSAKNNTNVDEAFMVLLKLIVASKEKNGGSKEPKPEKKKGGCELL